MNDRQRRITAFSVVAITVIALFRSGPRSFLWNTPRERVQIAYVVLNQIPCIGFSSWYNQAR